MQRAAAWCRNRPVRARAVPPTAEAHGCAEAGANGGRLSVDRAPPGVGAGDRGNQLCWSSNRSWLACTERNDAANRIVGGDPDGHPVAWNHFDAEAAHAAAELGQHFVAGVALHTVEPAAVNGDHGALHVDEIVLAQLLAHPLIQTNIVPQMS